MGQEPCFDGIFHRIRANHESCTTLVSPRKGAPSVLLTNAPMRDVRDKCCSGGLTST
jgi:hypothetical protein